MKKYIILGHENPDVDSIISGILYERYLLRKGYNAEFIIPDQNIELETVQICLAHGINPYDFIKDLPIYDEDIEFILVDHHEHFGIKNVIQVIDHHPTNKRFNIPKYTNKPSSSTTCLIVRENEFYFTKDEIKLAIVAAMVDTASFHSTKSLEDDKKWAIRMCKEYNLNYDELYKTGLCITDISDINKASLNGLKKYNFNGHLVESSYIQLTNIPKHTATIYQIVVELLPGYIFANNLDMFVFIVHDMNNFESTVYRITKDGITKVLYDKYESRGNIIMPEIERLFTSPSLPTLSPSILTSSNPTNNEDTINLSKKPSTKLN